MSKKRICDRCEKVIEYKGWTMKFKNVFKRGKRIELRQIHNGNRNMNSQYNDSSFELCPECTEDFKTFLVNRSTKE